MMSIDIIFLYALFFYYFVLILLFFLTMLRKNSKDKGLFYQWLIMFFMPFSGLLFLMIPMFNSDYSEDLYEFSGNSKEKLQKLYIADNLKDQEVVSIQDVLAINSVYEKRNVVMDLFSHESTEYVKELKIALRDRDTEVSHYASAAITALKNRLERKIYTTKKEYLDRPSDTNAINYLHSIKSYIDSGLLNDNRIQKYEELFCCFIENWKEEDHKFKQQEFPTYLTYLIHLGEESKAIDLAERFVKETKSQEAYVSAIKVSYYFQKDKDFRRYLNNLKSEEFVLTDYNYDILQFFLQDEVDYER